MTTVYLDEDGYLIRIVGAHTVSPGINFSYDTGRRSHVLSDEVLPVIGIFVGGEAVITISYENNGSIRGIYSGKAADKVTVNIG